MLHRRVRDVGIVYEQLDVQTAQPLRYLAAHSTKSNDPHHLSPHLVALQVEEGHRHLDQALWPAFLPKDVHGLWDVTQAHQHRSQRELGHGLSVATRRVEHGYAPLSCRCDIHIDRIGATTGDHLKAVHLLQHSGTYLIYLGDEDIKPLQSTYQLPASQKPLLVAEPLIGHFAVLRES